MTTHHNLSNSSNGAVQYGGLYSSEVTAGVFVDWMLNGQWTNTGHNFLGSLHEEPIEDLVEYSTTPLQYTPQGRCIP